MSANIMKNGKLLGAALLLLVCAGVLFALSVSAPDEKAPAPAVNVKSEQTQDLAPPPPANQENLTARAPNGRIAEIAEAQPDSESALGKGEMEHLSDVFLNSVYPSFQYQFQLDLEGRAAIDVFVASMPDELSREDLDAISDMIETRLLSPEAGDLAFIITHLYRLEQEEARILNEGPPVTTMEGQLEAQEQLSQLRNEWFGPELSERLFGVDAAGAISGPAMAESQPDGDGTEEPPEARTGTQAELADTESNWQRRYQEFLAEKQVIDRAGLDQSEKDRQIEILLQQHYTPQEIEAAKAYGDVGGYE
jgi:hypothetical protein